MGLRMLHSLPLRDNWRYAQRRWQQTVYIADAARVRCLDVASWSITTVAGDWDEGQMTLTGLAISADGRSIYASDIQNHKVSRTLLSSLQVQ